MKPIKFIVLIAATLTTAWQLHAQNWEIINPGYIYNFQYSDSEYYLSNSLWTDSVEVQGNDSLLYLSRRAVRDSIYLLANQPHFLQRKVLVTDSLVHFYDTASYVIKRKFDVGTSWLFDTTNNITASCTGKYSGLTFGNADSIKVITLSNTDTILLSKNYGILQFPDFGSGERYSLKGIDNLQIGECSPKFADFFTFEVGDVFVYKKHYQDPECIYEGFEKYIIMQVLSLQDTLSYQVSKETWYMQFQPCWGFNLSGYHTDTTVINYSSDDYLISNYYNNQLIANYDSDLIWAFVPSGNGSYYCQAKSYLDDLGIITKSIGSSEEWWLENTVFEESTIQDLLNPTSATGPNVYIQKVKKGIGVYEDFFGMFETGRSTELIAWQTQTSSFGNLDTLPEWWYSNPEIESKSISIYPNPSNGEVHISGLMYSPYHLSLFDISGKHILERQIESNETTIQLDGIRDGVYILVLRNQRETIRKRLIIRKD
ncbi:MAG: T9SS type A sorting domain-containing protein [Bacteroidales bacterium]|nr:T9SS type A sorting domain-containing protein [Bacteroidales bacterium]